MYILIIYNNYIKYIKSTYILYIYIELYYDYDRNIRQQCLSGTLNHLLAVFSQIYGCLEHMQVAIQNPFLR